VRYLIPQDVLYQELPGEAVVLNLATAEYFHLNQLGHAAWEMIRSGADRKAIDEKITREYDASPERIRSDLDAFLKQLVELKLVVSHEE
jgi:Coenzyme PQQ synthesis protein D (PqqD)